ncbi:MAG: hypothetical protein M0006_15300 [Magnetospirillum sp.]|nr:hypothetical protein [Magnetospirillum sp.]
MTEREMFQEINALIGAVAKALGVSEIEVVTAIEQGRLSMELLTDAEGRHYIQTSCEGKSARIYDGAIFRPGDTPGT